MDHKNSHKGEGGKPMKDVVAHKLLGEALYRKMGKEELQDGIYEGLS